MCFIFTIFLSLSSFPVQLPQNHSFLGKISLVGYLLMIKHNKKLSAYVLMGGGLKNGSPFGELFF
jgi:hypothetical protein